MRATLLQCESCHEYCHSEDIVNCDECNKLICRSCEQVGICPTCLQQEINDMSSCEGLILN